MKTVLIYCLGCNKRPYPDLMKVSMETWDSVQVDGVDTRFYCGGTSPSSHTKILQFNVGDHYEAMGEKDIAAYEWALANLQWDYMARINASCYVKKRKLAEVVQDLPQTRLFRGVITGGKNPFVWGGAQYIISRDVIQAFVDNKHLWDHGPMEDVAMSVLASRLGIPWDGTGRVCSINRHGDGWRCICYGGGMGFDFKDMCEMSKAEDQCFIRVKQDLQRHIDMDIMRKLHACGIQ